MEIKHATNGSFGPLTQRGFKKLADKVNERKKYDTSGNKRTNSNVFLAKIVAASTVITNRRWKYTWVEAEQYTSGSQKFQTKGGSTFNSDTTTLGYAYNTCESLQQDSGTIDGPGLTHGNIPSGFYLKPIAAGTVVLMHTSFNATDGAQAFSFCLTNAIDGVCS